MKQKIFQYNSCELCRSRVEIVRLSAMILCAQVVVNLEASKRYGID